MLFHQRCLLNTRISCGGGAWPPSQRADPVSCIRLLSGPPLLQVAPQASQFIQAPSANLRQVRVLEP